MKMLPTSYIRKTPKTGRATSRLRKIRTKYSDDILGINKTPKTSRKKRSKGRRYRHSISHLTNGGTEYPIIANSNSSNKIISAKGPSNKKQKGLRGFDRGSP
jgi:hypothetical protein